MFNINKKVFKSIKVAFNYMKSFKYRVERFLTQILIIEFLIKLKKKILIIELGQHNTFEIISHEDLVSE